MVKGRKHLKLYLEGRIDIREAYSHSKILRRVVARILENARLSDDEAHGLYGLYAQYGPAVVKALARDGYVQTKTLRLSPNTAKIIVRPTPKLLSLIDETAI